MLFRLVMMKDAFKGLYHTHRKLFFFLLLCLPLLFVKDDINGDIWFYLNNGRYLFEHGFQFPTVEPFTIHTFPFQMHKWLYSVIAWVLYDNVGYKAITFVLLYLAFLSTIACVYILYREISENNEVSILWTVIVAFSLLPAFVMKRPQLFSYGLIALEIYFLERYTKMKKWQYLISLPVIMVIMMQIHTTIAPVMALFTIPYLLEIGIRNDRQGLKHAMIFGVLSVLVMCINPYGVDAVSYILAGLLDSSGNKFVWELTKPSFELLLRGMPTLIILMHTLFSSDNKPNRYTLFGILAFMLALTSFRNLAYAIILSPIIILSSKKSFGEYDIAKRVITFITIGMIVITIITPKSSFNLDMVGAVSDTIAESNDKEPNETLVYTTYQPGSYLEFAGYKTYMDERMEIFKLSVNGETDVWSEFTDLLAGEINLTELDAKYDFDYFVVSASNGNLIHKQLQLWDKVEEISEFTIGSNDYIIYKKVG